MYDEGSSITSLAIAETLAAFNGYGQQNERNCYDEKDEWQPVAHPKSFVLLILM
jgi:hypothetical protein